MSSILRTIFLIGALAVFANPHTAFAQEQEDEQQPVEAHITGNKQSFIGKSNSFDSSTSIVAENTTIKEVVWDFGDGTRTTGEKVAHEYKTPGTFTVSLTITTEDNTIAKDSIDIEIYKHVMVVISDNTIPEDQLEINNIQATKAGLLIVNIRSKSGGPEALVEEELTTQLIDARDAVSNANTIVTWTSGGVGANILSKYAQHIRQTTQIAETDTDIENKGVVMLSDTPFGVLAPIAQSAYDQLKPSYILLTKPQAFSLLLQPQTAEEVKNAIINSPTTLTHRLIGTFSSRTVNDINITNFISFGINYLVNKGVPINNITPILMLPIIATILAFSRQVIGIKAFGITTPALTTLTFLVMGLQYGLIVFGTVLLMGTLTRLIMRRLHLLYLPRMALVLTNISLAILILLGISVATDQGAPLLSFSIFPILILTLLAEEFIALQFKSGARTAATITAWTIGLSIACYFIVSWQLLRTIVISYPEVVLLAIPANILLGRFGGLRLTEYFRFRNLLRHTQ